MGKSIDVTFIDMKMATITTGTSKVWHRQCWTVLGKSIDVTFIDMKMVTITTGTSKVWQRQCWTVWVNL